MNEWMNDEFVIYEKNDFWSDLTVEEYNDEWNEWLNEWIDEWMNRWMNE